MQTFIQLVATGLQIAAVYVLFSLGLTLIFGVMQVVNFAHGQFFTMTALLIAVTLPLLVAQGMVIWLAYGISVLFGILASMVLGIVIYQFGLRFFQRDMAGSFILTVGIVLLLEGVFLHYFGGVVRTVPPFVDGSINLLGVNITLQRVVLIVVSAIFTLILYRVLATTRIGKAMRAVSIDHEAAMLQGIPYKRIAYAGFLIATFMGALAGAVMAPLAMISPTVGSDYLVKGFIAVIIGGLGSVPGAIVGSLFIGMIESFVGYFFDPSIANIAIFALVIITLLVRPNGLLGHG
ncbi:MAG: branched-chain amino acid ABC transporter permease [Burkholderiales bacterium]